MDKMSKKKLSLKDIILGTSLAASIAVAAAATGSAMHYKSENKDLKDKLEEQSRNKVVDRFIDGLEENHELIQKMRMYREIRTGECDKVQNELEKDLDEYFSTAQKVMPTKVYSALADDVYFNKIKKNREIAYDNKGNRLGIVHTFYEPGKDSDLVLQYTLYDGEDKDENGNKIKPKINSFDYWLVDKKGRKIWFADEYPEVNWKYHRWWYEDKESPYKVTKYMPDKGVIVTNFNDGTFKVDIPVDTDSIYDKEIGNITKELWARINKGEFPVD